VTTVKLTVIPKPAEGTRVVREGRPPFFTGNGDTDLICGGCSVVLASGIINGQIRGIVFKCPECSSFCEQTTPIPLSIFQKRVDIHPGVYTEPTMHIPPNMEVVGLSKQ